MPLVVRHSRLDWRLQINLVVCLVVGCRSTRIYALRLKISMRPQAIKLNVVNHYVAPPLRATKARLPCMMVRVVLQRADELVVVSLAWLRLAV